MMGLAEMNYSHQLITNYLLDDKITVSDLKILAIVAQAYPEEHCIANKTIARILGIKSPTYVSKRISHLSKLGLIQSRTITQTEDPENFSGNVHMRFLRVPPHLLKPKNSKERSYGG